VLVTDLPISRADRTTAAVRERASEDPASVSGAPSHPEGPEVVWAIDRWTNEGGFVPDVDADFDPWRRH
jgi:hypothetical protein